MQTHIQNTERLIREINRIHAQYSQDYFETQTHVFVGGIDSGVCMITVKFLRALRRILLSAEKKIMIYEWKIFSRLNGGLR